jgi:hypothetical protein
VRFLSVASAAILAFYLAAHPASVTSPLISGAGYYGLLERALILTEIALVVGMAAATAIERRTSAALPSPTLVPARRRREEAA